MREEVITTVFMLWRGRRNSSFSKYVPKRKSLRTTTLFSIDWNLLWMRGLEKRHFARWKKLKKKSTERIEYLSLHITTYYSRFPSPSSNIQPVVLIDKSKDETGWDFETSRFCQWCPLSAFIVLSTTVWTCESCAFGTTGREGFWGKIHMNAFFVETVVPA